MNEQKSMTNPVYTKWYFLPLALSVLFALYFGLNYGISNHNTYLLHGLRLFNPEILKYDWLASETTTYHPVFSYLAYLFFSLDQSGWIFAIANIFTITAGGIALSQLLKHVCGNDEVKALYIFLMILGVWAITQTDSVSGSYIYAGIFQASLVGAVAYLFALNYLVQKKYIISSIFLAIGGLFHANYLVLCFPLFFFIHVLLGYEGIIKRMFQQFSVPFIAFLALLPLILGAAGDEAAAQGRHIFQSFVAPFHYLPNTYLKEFIPFFAWQVLAFAAGWHLLKQKAEIKTLLYALMVLVGLIWLATLLTTVVFIPTISQLYFWRLAPFSDLLAMLIVFYVVITYLKNNTEHETLSLLRKVLVSVASLVLLAYYVFETKLAVLMGMVVFAAIIIRHFQWKIFAPLQPKFALLVSVIIFAIGSVLPAKDGTGRSSLLTGMKPDEQQLYQWAKTSTADSAQFLTSPQLYNFRFHAQRAVFVDKKSTPILGKEIVEWYRRIELVSGKPGVESIAESIAGYKTINLARIEKIKSKYPIDYVILEHDQTQLDLPAVFENDTFLVYQLK